MGSADTQTRARDGQVEIVSSDTELVQVSDYILSIVPPRDALVGTDAIQRTIHMPATKPPLNPFLVYCPANCYGSQGVYTQRNPLILSRAQRHLSPERTRDSRPLPRPVFSNRNRRRNHRRSPPSPDLPRTHNHHVGPPAREPHALDAAQRPHLGPSRPPRRSTIRRPPSHNPQRETHLAPLRHRVRAEDVLRGHHQGLHRHLHASIHHRPPSRRPLGARAGNG